MKLSLILEVIDRATRPLNRGAQGVRAYGKSATDAGRGVGAMDRAMIRAERAATRLGRAGGQIGSSITRGATRGIAAIGRLDRRMQISQASMERMAFGAGQKIGNAIRGGVVAGGAAAVAGLWKTVTAGIDFERYRTMLTGLEGSVAGGNRAMDWVTDFARSTPYEIGEVMDAFIALKAYGIDPTDGSLRTLGDAAAGMGKKLQAAVEMIADAQTGEFERLKEFGVRAKVQGDRVSFSFRKNGKDMTRTARNNATEIQSTLGSIFNDRFAGGMDRLAKNTDGKWSNLMDRMTFSAKRVWEGGFGTAVNEQLDRMNAGLDEAEKSGALKKWAEDTGKGIGGFIKTMASADWERIAGDIHGVASAIGQVARALEWLDRQQRAFADFETKAVKAMGSLGSISPSPRGGLKYNAPEWISPKPRAAAPSRKSPAGRGNGAGVPFFDASSPQSRTPPPQKVKVDIELKGAGAKDARTRVSSSSKDVPVSVWNGYRGTAMRGAQ